MPCSSHDLAPASTNEKPPAESTACWTTASPVPRNPEWKLSTNVDRSVSGSNVHSIREGDSLVCQSSRMRRSGSTAMTSTSVEKPYMLHVHVTREPDTREPDPSVNQNFVIDSTSTNASKTSATGRRISIPVAATGGCVIETRSDPIAPSLN